MDKKKILKGIAAAASIVLGVALVLGLYMDRKEEQQKSAQLARQNEEAQPYEKEIKKINVQMEERKQELSYISDTAKLLVGYRMYVPENLAMIQKQAETYGFSPIIVLDCGTELEQLTTLIQTVAGEGWDIMLTGSPTVDEFDEKVTKVRDVMGKLGISDTGVFLLRDSDYSEENVEILVANGFKGYTCYSSEVTNGCEEDGTVYFEYWYYKQDSSLLKDKMEQMVSGRKTMIVVFGLESLQTDDLSEEDIEKALDLTKGYVEDGKMVYSSTAEVVHELSNINEIKAQRQAEYEEYAAQQQEKIAELKEKIDQIYGK